jgi:RNA polymerase sigma-70 factor (ECF subfamily)
MHNETNLACENDTQDMGRQLVGLRRELFSHAVRLTRDVVQAEDLMQDTVERALRFEDRFEQGTNLRAWTHQILANLFITRCRRSRREGRALAVLSSDPCSWTASRPASPAYQELSRSTRRAIDQLPQPFRSTVLLIDIEELSYKAAADRMGIPVGTVMSRLHRGRRLLADALREPEEQRQAA